MSKRAADLAASLRKRVTIQSKTSVSDGQGGWTETWADGDTVWASIEPLSGFQKFQAMQMQTPMTHKIVMRYRSDVSTLSRLIYSGRVFWVKEAINIEERSRFLELRVQERGGILDQVYTTEDASQPYTTENANVLYTRE